MSNKFLLTYAYERSDSRLGFGSVTITQEKYSPINQDIIDNALRFVREEHNIPENLKIVPIGFFRYEE